MQMMAVYQVTDTPEFNDLPFGFVYSKFHRVFVANCECWLKHVCWTPKHLQKLVLNLQVKFVFEKSCSRWFSP